MEKDIVITTLRIPKYMHSKLIKIAKKKHESLNTIMKQAIDMFLESKEEKN